MNSNFFINEFREIGYEVEYWSVYKCLKYSKSLSYKVEDSNSIVKDFADEKELLREIKFLNKNDIVCLEIWLRWSTLPIFEELMKSGANIFGLDYYKNQPVNLVSSKSIIKDLLYSFDLNRLFSSLRVRISEFLLKGKVKSSGCLLPKTIFTPGKLAENYSNENQTYISINHFDYYTYENTIKESKLIDQDYFVFIDIYLPFHPDIARAGQSSISASKYYTELSNYFKKIELKYNKIVVIAAHPKAYELKKYLSFPIFYGKTANLIKYSSGVFSHHSAAINFAVLGDIPIQLIYSDEFLLGKGKTYLLKKMFNSIIGYQKVLGLRADNISNEFIDPFLPVEKFNYNQYIQNYILSKDKNLDNFEIIHKNLMKNNK